MSNAVQVGIGLIKNWEKCRLMAFIPIPGDPPTIGWGATGPGIIMGLVWTQEEADADLINRVNTLTSQIRSVVTIPITDNQLGALIDFAYNLGFAALKGSTLLKKLNAGYTDEASNELLKWDIAHGKVVQGLSNRREDEQRVFNS